MVAFGVWFTTEGRIDEVFVCLFFVEGLDILGDFFGRGGCRWYLFGFDGSSCYGRLYYRFWMVLCACCCLLFPFGLMIMVVDDASKTPNVCCCFFSALMLNCSLLQ